MFSLYWLDINTFRADLRMDQEVVSCLLHIPITFHESIFATVHISQTCTYKLLQFNVLDSAFNIPFGLF